MNKVIFLLIAVFAAYLYATAAPVPVDLSIPDHKIGNNLSYFEDTTGTMEFDEIRKLPLDAFAPLNKRVDSHLFTSSAYWYRFDASNPLNAPLERLIVFEIPWLDEITIKIIDSDHARTCLKGGDTFTYDKRSIANPLPNFLHAFKPGISTVYVQVKTRDPFIVPISVVDHSTFWADAAENSAYTGFMYGIIISMLLYNLFLFVSIKTRYYLFYVLYLGFFLAMNASYKCFTFEWFFYDNPTLQNWAESTTIFLFSISGLLFAQSFLNLKAYFPRLNRMTNLLILVYIATMTLTFLMGYHYHVMTAIALSVVYSLYIFGIGVYVLSKGHRFARFFLLGTTAGLLGTSITALTVMALIPYSDVGFHAIDYGLVIDAILLALALAERVKIAQKEKLIAQTEAKTDVLTGLLNRRAYYEIASAEVNRSKRNMGPLSLMMFDIDFFKKVNDTYGHAAGDHVLQEISSLLKKMVRESDYAFRTGGEEFLILLPDTDAANAALLAERIRKAVEERVIVYGGHEISVTASLGIGEFHPDENGIKEAEKRADEGLYRAKKEGRNTIIAEG